MAIIPQFNAPAADQMLRPSDAGEQAMFRTGRVEQYAARTVGVDYAHAIGAPIEAAVNAVHGIARQMDQASLGPKMLDYNAQQIAAYKEQSKTWDPADPTAPRKFLTQYQSGLEHLAAGMISSDDVPMANELALRFSSHMANVVQADAAIRAGSAILTNLHNSTQAGMSAVANDPSGWGVQEAAIDHQTQALISGNPNLSAAQVAEIQRAALRSKQMIGQSAAQAAASANPEQFIREAQAGEWDKAGINIPTLVQFGKRQLRINQEMAMENFRTNLLEQEVQQQNVAAHLYASAIHWDPATGRPVANPQAIQDTVNNLAHLGRSGPTVLRTVTGLVNYGNNPPSTTATDPIALAAAKQAIVNGGVSHPMTATQIFNLPGVDARTKAKLYQMQQRILQDPAYRLVAHANNAWERSVAPLLSPPGASTDYVNSGPLLHANIVRFEEDYQQGADAAYDHGFGGAPPGPDAVKKFRDTFDYQRYAVTSQWLQQHPNQLPPLASAAAAPRAQPGTDLRALGAKQAAALKAHLEQQRANMAHSVAPDYPSQLPGGG